MVKVLEGMLLAAGTYGVKCYNTALYFAKCKTVIFESTCFVILILNCTKALKERHYVVLLSKTHF